MHQEMGCAYFGPSWPSAYARDHAIERTYWDGHVRIICSSFSFATTVKLRLE
jgi:hypothetical protein